MSTMPTYNFKSDITDADLDVEIAKTKSSGGKSLKPGNHDLTILSAVFHKMSDGDPSWAGYKVELGRDEKTIRTYLMIPTAGPRYNKPGIKNPMIMYVKLMEFLDAAGLKTEQEIIGKVLGQLYANPSKLVGKVVNVDIGYKGPYVGYVGENQFKLFERDGTPFKATEVGDTPFPDRDSAVAEAASYGVVAQTFPEITKFHAAKKVVKAADTDPWEK